MTPWEKKIWSSHWSKKKKKKKIQSFFCFFFCFVFWFFLLQSRYITTQPSSAYYPLWGNIVLPSTTLKILLEYLSFTFLLQSKRTVVDNPIYTSNIPWENMMLPLTEIISDHFSLSPLHFCCSQDVSPGNPVWPHIIPCRGNMALLPTISKIILE